MSIQSFFLNNSFSVVGGDGFTVGVLILSLKLGVRFGSALNFC